MKKLSSTIAQLAALRAAVAPLSGDKVTKKLQTLEGFGTNPGALGAKMHVPVSLAKRPALVVVLHGCTQSADGYDHGSGWSQLADKHGFALLFPEQKRSNNPNLCFNWFSPADNRRDHGEALSIRQMIEAMVKTHGIDSASIFVTGLSAGGAMASIMLATYPEVFAGGAIIAGLPHGAAANVPQALEAMRSPKTTDGKDLGDQVRKASGHSGPWPRIAVWHGTADATVNSANADAILAQWISVHGVDATPATTNVIAGHSHRVWKNSDGRAVVEDFRIGNMGHGTPLATTGADACGVAMPYMLDVGISSTRHIAASWSLLEERASTTASPIASLRSVDAPLDRPMSSRTKGGVQKVIEDALRAAGLVR
ncbi:PHB depolymerase family esterase [soil metagenome]|uniref:extracellular catalytic domain type 1 short-chain-length polyhydroxyalkanoate depolymerase n=1 Tax=Sphingobium sp. CECT 9361 TaxID=2845384 RepID=UPI001E2BA3C8|nr:PHB depolymerase family esterase [Sphingobium sp. CECT 9361]CAH0348646.1 hypothetical protein SPH9361_00205 [Sphingobium sp. CECT 9361]